MSGIEVVGVVLGAVPLIIEAMKQYGEGVSFHAHVSPQPHT
jgi:hypothetical protein